MPTFGFTKRGMIEIAPNYEKIGLLFIAGLITMIYLLNSGVL